MNRQKIIKYFFNPLYPPIITVVYSLAVLICIPLAFDYEGSIDLCGTSILSALPLPWSVLLFILFSWQLIHGAALEFLTLMYLLSAVCNATVLCVLSHYILRAYRRYYKYHWVG